MENEEALLTAKAARLRYVTTDMPGISRVKNGNGVFYTDTKGEKIQDEAILERIRKLVLPPAWEQVWICPYENGHLQAIGVDTKGRRQYRYHTTWQQVRNETKYDRLQHFGEKLPQIRKRVKAGLRKRDMNKEKVLCIALSVLQETWIRVGNSSYEKLYGSYGLTTLRNQHVKINGNTLFFHFKGKKGVEQKITIKHSSLAKLLKKVREIPGQELFQYYDENGEHKGLGSGDINDFLKECTGEDFTCKDFRTWAGSVHALNMLADMEAFDTAAACKRNIVSVMDGVACKLGNTRAVCKKYYVHPRLLIAYEEGKLEPYMQQVRESRSKAGKGELHNDEKVLLKFLKKC
ncbi:DNA topoisomerase IB [Chitinophaga sp. GbtcB8]|uniref:DNA topoisomerase IB n=1 Tax=Chitinophaga sp. GbtcB8 TaxID=2824753 RepID=UPI001C30FDCE|nr:DNA topoisomerase IB [Chitinophaga sp. GbtcB8]